MTQLTLPPITIDFETYYGKDYTLKKLNIVQYIYSADFQVIGFGYRVHGSNESEWFTGTHAQVLGKLKSLQLDKRLVIAHHAMFDGAILEWKFGIKPARYFCTMMAARPFIVPFTGSSSLAKCAELIGLPSKGDEVEHVSDKRREQFSAVDMQKYSSYCLRDVLITEGIYDWLAPKLPADEAELLHLTQLKFLRPRILLDKKLLDDEKERIAVDEAKSLMILSSLGLKRINVTSNPQLAEALKARGVTVPMKMSDTTGIPTYAFAKKDPEFLALRSHPNPEVQLLVECRLTLKSSIERTRIEGFRTIADLAPAMPVPLLYYGAHTGRFSGMMGINLQNLPRGSGLRHSLRAPPGYKFVTADLSAIEARITAVLAGQWDLVARFAEDADVYSEFATDIYGYPVSNCVETEDERFVGKMSILGLGFGMGAPKFDITLQGAGKTLGEQRVATIVALYRRKYQEIPRLWRKMDAAIAKMMELGKGSYFSFPEVAPSCLRFEKGKVVLPNGMPIHYPKLSRNNENKVTYTSYETPAMVYNKFIWGGALTENVVQALARIVLSRAELRLARAGLEAVLQVHDELVYLVPEHAVAKVKEVLKLVLSDPVEWMPRLPLACKIGVGDTYGEAK